jgi:hypothetical protein
MVNIKPNLPRVQIRPLRIAPRLPVGTTSRLNKKREQPSEAADGGPQPEPPTYQSKRTRPRTAKVAPAVRFIAPLPRTKPTMPVAVIDPDDLMTIPPHLRGINSEDLQKLKDFQDMATNGPNNAAPDPFGPRQDGRSGDEPGYGGPIGTFDHEQSRNTFEGSNGKLPTFGFDPNNPGGGDTRQSAGFHTPAKYPGAAGGAINDPREKASDGEGMVLDILPLENGGYSDQLSWGDESGHHTVTVTHTPDGEGGSTTTYSTTDVTKFGTTMRDDIKKVDSDGNAVVERGEGRTELHPVEITVERNPDGQPGVEGRGPGGADNCGWNPMNGCTKKSTPIWKATVQPGAHQDTGGRSAGPSLGQEAVTNTGDGTFDSGVSGGGGGGGQPDPCVVAGSCGGPIGDAGGGLDHGN